MYPSPGRLCQVLVGVSLVFHLGCQQSLPLNSTLGNLPQQPSHAKELEISASTYFAHAHLLERQGQFEQAARQYHRALALQPELLSARNRLGITLNKPAHSSVGRSRGIPRRRTCTTISDSASTWRAGMSRLRPRCVERWSSNRTSRGLT